MEEHSAAARHYAAAIQLINNSEAATWSRLQNFLTGSGLLCAAWGLSADQGKARSVLAFLGIAVSVAYLLLMVRSRTFVGRFVEYAKRLEEGAGHTGPLTDGAKGKDAFPWENKLGSKVLASMVPAAYALAFFLLLLFSTR